MAEDRKFVDIEASAAMAVRRAITEEMVKEEAFLDLTIRDARDLAIAANKAVKPFLQEAADFGMRRNK